MPAYVDSSLLLSMLLNDENAARASQAWREHQDRVASTLIELECITVLRRVAKQYPRRLPKKRLSLLRERLASYLEEVSLKHIDDTVIEIIRREDRLAGCRTLDAVHIATALLFQSVADGPLHVCTLDQRMAKACKQFGLVPIP